MAEIGRVHAVLRTKVLDGNARALHHAVMYIVQSDLNDGAEFGKAFHKCLPPGHEHIFHRTGKVALRVLFFRCPCGNAENFS